MGGCRGSIAQLGFGYLQVFFSIFISFLVLTNQGYRKVEWFHDDCSCLKTYYWSFLLFVTINILQLFGHTLEESWPYTSGSTTETGDCTFDMEVLHITHDFLISKYFIFL